jgi:hypothetical protein
VQRGGVYKREKRFAAAKAAAGFGKMLSSTTVTNTGD